MPSKCSDQRTIGGPKLLARVLTSQNRKLVAQQHQLYALGELGSPTANEQPQNGSKGKVSEGEEHRAILPGPVRADRSCAVRRFLVFARPRETKKPGRANDPSRRNPSSLLPRRRRPPVTTQSAS